MGKEALVLMVVFAGGGLGSAGRFILSGAVQRLSGGAFPWGTFSVNALGALLIGVVWAWVCRHEMPGGLRVFLFTGILGGFTTFSAFSLETLLLLREGAWRLGVLNVLLNNFVCLAVAACGFLLMRAVLR